MGQRALCIVVSLLAFILLVPEAGAVRNSSARHAFQKSVPCPATGKAGRRCPGYVIDHIVPLACGGADSPSNMQWQTVAEAKAKDRWERNCKASSR